MKTKHLDIDTLAGYLLNKGSMEEETVIQEHLSDCPECRKKLQDLRSLKTAFTAPLTQISFRKRLTIIYHNTWFRVAASLVIVAGIGFAIYTSTRPKGFPVKEGIVPETVLSIDSLPPAADSTATEPEVYKDSL